MSIRKQELEQRFYEYSKSFQPNEAIVLDVWENRKNEQIKGEKRLQIELGQLAEKKKRVEELVTKGVFDDQTYKQQVEDIKNEMLSKQIELNELRIDLEDIGACLNYCKYFLTNIADLWANAELDLKQRLQTLLLPEKIYYEGGTFRTTVIALILKQLQSENLSLCKIATQAKSVQTINTILFNLMHHCKKKIPCH